MNVVPFQRRTSDDLVADRARLAAAEQQLERVTAPATRLEALDDVAELARLTGAHDRAIAASEHAIELAEELSDPRRVAAHLVRRATALQYADRHAEALAVYDAFFARALHDPEFEDYVHFAFQHRGKCRAELDDHAGALRDFHHALDIRLEHVDETLVASTRSAIRALARRTR